MTRIATATGTKQGHVIRYDDREAFAAAMSDMADGPVLVRVERLTPEAVRSNQANRYYWAIVGEIEKSAGQPKDDLHDFFCERFLSRVVTLINKTTGEVQEERVSGRSSRLSPEEFRKFVDNVKLFAAEFFGIEDHRDDQW